MGQVAKFLTLGVAVDWAVASKVGPEGLEKQAVLAGHKQSIEQSCLPYTKCSYTQKGQSAYTQIAKEYGNSSAKSRESLQRGLKVTQSSGSPSGKQWPPATLESTGGGPTSRGTNTKSNIQETPFGIGKAMYGQMRKQRKQQNH